MKEKIKIGNFETVCILINMICTKIVLNFPRKAAEDGGTAGWLVTVFSSILVFLIFLLLLKLYKKFEGNDLLYIAEKGIGKIGRIIIGVVILSSLVFITAVVLREFAEDMKVISLSNTPISVVTILFSISMIIGAYIGFEGIARIHAILVPYAIVNYILLIIFVIPRMDISKIMPWFGFGALNIVKKGAIDISLFSELLLLFFIAPYLGNKKSFSKSGKIGLIISSSFLVIAALFHLLIYFYTTENDNFLPFYQLARFIDMGRFFTRVEAAFMFFWAPVAFLYLSTGLFFSTYIFSKTFEIKYYRPLIIPFTILIYTISLVPENLISSVNLETNIYRTYSSIISFGIPLIIMLVALMRIKLSKKGE